MRPEEQKLLRRASLQACFQSPLMIAMANPKTFPAASPGPSALGKGDAQAFGS